MSTVWSRTFCRGVWWFTLLMLFAELGTCGGGWAQEVKSGPAPSSPAADLERSKAVLQTVYEQQQQFARRTGRWAADWQELGWQPEPAEYRERIWFWIAPGESSITLEAPRGELGANRWRISARICGQSDPQAQASLWKLRRIDEAFKLATELSRRSFFAKLGGRRL